MNPRPVGSTTGAGCRSGSMDSISSIDAAPGPAQIMMLRKTMDAATSQAAALLEVLPPPPSLRQGAVSRVDVRL